MQEDKEKPIGEILVSNDIVSEDQVKNALDLQSKEGGRLCYNLIKLGYVSTERLTNFFQDYFGFVPFRLDDIVSDPAIISLIPAELANFYKMVPTKLNDGVLSLAIAEGQEKNQKIIPAIEELTGYEVEPVVCPASTPSFL